ncbi:MAG TPA: transposase family protein [Anaerolineales bacterium]|nr:transposase family protein [Anaerolineales bacterium]
MNNNDILNKLLGIENLHVMRAEFVGEEQINLVVESTLPVASCPECGHLSEQVHDLSEVQMIRDLPIAERQCYLSYRARRFKCAPCPKTFVERVDWKRTGLSYTERYERQVYQRVRRETVSQVAQAEGLSEEATQAVFEHWAKKRSRAAATPR